MKFKPRITVRLKADFYTCERRKTSILSPLKNTSDVDHCESKTFHKMIYYDLTFDNIREIKYHTNTFQ
jgi:hypothetical protein